MFASGNHKKGGNMRRGYLTASRFQHKHANKLIIARRSGGVAFIGIAITVLVAASLIVTF